MKMLIFWQASFSVCTMPTRTLFHLYFLQSLERVRHATSTYNWKAGSMVENSWGGKFLRDQLGFQCRRCHLKKGFQDAFHTLPRNIDPHGKEHLLLTKSSNNVILSNVLVEVIKFSPLMAQIFFRAQCHFGRNSTGTSKYASVLYAHSFTSCLVLCIQVHYRGNTTSIVFLPWSIVDPVSTPLLKLVRRMRYYQVGFLCRMSHNKDTPWLLYCLQPKLHTQ